MKRIAFVMALLVAQAAQAELSSNVGWQSHYIFRGVPQHESSAQGGLDFENSGFYLGTWAADVGMGAEVDVYGGYNWSNDDFSFGIGSTGYFYTDDFDDTYQEINLSFAYGPVSIDYANGDYDNFAGPTQDYSFYSVSYEHESGFYGIVGGFSEDFDGNYYTLGYGFDVNGIDFAVDWIYTDDKLAGGLGENNLVFSIGKGFDLNK